MMENFYFLEAALRSLNINERRRFERFLRSPYFFKKHSDIHISDIFYKNLKKHLRKKQITEADYRKIVLNIYPKEGSKWKEIFTRLKYDLLLCFCRFIAHEQFENDSFQYFFTLTGELEKRKLEDIYVHYFKPGLDRMLAKRLREPELTYYNWKICRTVNIHKENSPSKDRKPRYKIQETGNGTMATRINIGAEDIWLERPDFHLEKMLLKEYFKNQLRELEMREKEYTKKKRRGGGKMRVLLKNRINTSLTCLV